MKALVYRRPYTIDVVHGWTGVLEEYYVPDENICINLVNGINIFLKPTDGWYTDGDMYNDPSTLVGEVDMPDELVKHIVGYLRLKEVVDIELKRFDKEVVV